MRYTTLLGALILSSAISGPVCAADESLQSLIRDLNSGSAAARVEAARVLGERAVVPREAVKALAKALGARNRDVVQESLFALQQIGPLAGDAVPALVGLLKSKDRILRHEALHALAAIGPEAAEAATAIKPLLNSSDGSLKTAAALALGSMLPDQRESLKPVIPHLIHSFRSPDAHVRQEAIMVLSVMGPHSVSALKDVVKQGDPRICHLACDALANIGPDAKAAVPDLIGAVRSSDERFCWHAVDALGAIGEAKLSLPALTSALSHDAAVVRAHSAAAIGRFGPAGKPAVRALTRTLNDRSALVRRLAVDALGEIGPDSAPAIPALVAALDDEEASVTINVVEALAAIGKPAVPAVAPLLKNNQLRELAAIMLAEIGPDAAEATPQLAAVLNDQSEDFVREVIIALAEIGPGAGAAVPPLLTLLKNEKSPARPGAAFALGKIGARQALPILEKTVQARDNDRLRRASAHALVTLEPDNAKYARVAIPELAAALTNEWSLVRREAASALGKLGPRAKSVVPQLATLIADEEFDVRAAALMSLAEIGPDSKAALLKITKALRDEVPEVAYTATFALGKIGAAADPTVPILKARLSSPDPFLRMVSAWALITIRPKDSQIVDSALPLLIEAMNHERPRARQEVILAIGKTGRSTPALVVALKAAAKDDVDQDVRQAANKVLNQLNK